MIKLRQLQKKEKQPKCLHLQGMKRTNDEYSESDGKNMAEQAAEFRYSQTCSHGAVLTSQKQDGKNNEY